MLQRIPRGDIHLFDGWGKTVNGCGEDGFIAHHNDGLPAVGNTVFLLEPLTDVAGLHILGLGTDERYLLVVVEMVVDDRIATVEFVGEA